MRFFHSLLCCCLTLLLPTACCGQQRRPAAQIAPPAPLRCGAERTEAYFPLLEGKHFALVVNHSSTIGRGSLVDSLCAAGLRPDFIFAPEHGFRGNHDAGAGIQDSRDTATGLYIVSLYGKNKKPEPAQMQGLDYVVFDLQDVGCRFYTYLSTLHYVMEACAENGVKLLVLDRPNPNDYIDGPVLESDCRSFVGLHPIPLLHGCTLGELARMINGEGWIADSCRLQVITIENWQHGQPYSLPVRPSPNLPNDDAIRLYPSLCLFEGSMVSVGRGTDWPFQVLGCPDSLYGQFSFKPESRPGAASHPPYQDQICYGLDLRNDSLTHGFSLQYLLYFLERCPEREAFFSQPRFFDLLAGNKKLRQQLTQGLSEAEIRSTWAEGLAAYKEKRSHYLLYP